MRVWDYLMRRKGLLCVLIAVFAVSALLGTRLFGRLGAVERLAEEATSSAENAANSDNAENSESAEPATFAMVHVTIADPATQSAGSVIQHTGSAINPTAPVESASEIPVPHTGGSTVSPQLVAGATPAEIVGAALFLQPSASFDSAADSTLPASTVAAWQAIAYSTTAALALGALALAVARFLC